MWVDLFSWFLCPSALPQIRTDSVLCTPRSVIAMSFQHHYTWTFFWENIIDSIGLHKNWEGNENADQDFLTILDCRIAYLHCIKRLLRIYRLYIDLDEIWDDNAEKSVSSALLWSQLRVLYRSSSSGLDWPKSMRAGSAWKPEPSSGCEKKSKERLLHCMLSVYLIMLISTVTHKECNSTRNVIPYITKIINKKSKVNRSVLQCPVNNPVTIAWPTQVSTQ